MFGGASFVEVRKSDVTVISALINLNAPQTSVNGKLVVTARTDLKGDVYLNGTVIIISPALPTTASPPNLHVSASGRLYKSTWTPA